MKQIFISQPMKGLTDEEIKEERKRIIKIIKEKYKDYEIIDSYFEEFHCGDEIKNKSIMYLAKSIELIAKADVCFFAKGWEYARGCRIEHSIARNYGVECLLEWGE